MGKKYVFLESKTKQIVPAIRGDGENHALHSLVDPEREAVRLLDTVKNEGFVIFLGLGGGFFVREALKRNITLVLAIDFDRGGVREIFSAIPDVISREKGKKAHLLVDPSKAEIERFILDHYHPVLMNGVRCLPLRPRTRVDPTAFKDAEETIAESIGKVAADFSTQSFFGLRWFSNILHNMKRLTVRAAALVAEEALPKVKHAAIAAAGPSLDRQIPLLRKFKETQGFVISTDTAFPRLVREGIEPDAVVSIDCQIWTCRHFHVRIPKNSLFFFALEGRVIDIDGRICFFAGGHPFSRYISRFVHPLLEIDTTGGNVTYAAVSLAEALGAETTTLYGADFSYLFGTMYARGTWLYDFYGEQANRFQSVETRFSDLLYRTPLEKKEGNSLKDGWYYETPVLAMYRQRLEEKVWRTKLIPFPAVETANTSCGVICGKSGVSTSKRNEEMTQSLRRVGTSALSRLNDYFEKVRALSFDNLDKEGALILSTLLPAMAGFKRRKPYASKEEILDMTKAFVMNETRLFENFSLAKKERKRGERG